MKLITMACSMLSWRRKDNSKVFYILVTGKGRATDNVSKKIHNYGIFVSKATAHWSTTEIIGHFSKSQQPISTIANFLVF
jgi:hypothetical protein